MTARQQLIEELEARTGYDLDFVADLTSGNMAENFAYRVQQFENGEGLSKTIERIFGDLSEAEYEARADASVYGRTIETDHR